MKYILMALSLALAGCGVTSPMDKLEDQTIKRINNTIEKIRKALESQNEIYRSKEAIKKAKGK
jgi:hypothetical protein